jgi:hypothetical protein
VRASGRPAPAPTDESRVHERDLANLPLLAKIELVARFVW